MLRKNKIHILIGSILLLAAFLRIYRISEYMTFLGDEGRDVLITKGILEGNLTLLGPRASAGDFFLGPIYYYIIAPFLFLSGYDPVGPAIMIALLSVATVYLIYRFGTEWFGRRAGIIAAALYAVSHLVIVYSRSSWNPNPMPFFSLVIFYLLWRSVKQHQSRLFFIIGILFGIMMQLHYLAVFVGIIMGVYVLFGNVILFFEKNVKKRTNTLHTAILVIKTVLKEYLLLASGFIVGISPFLLFEIRHGFPNIRTIFSFIFVNNVQAKYEGTLGSFWDIIQDVGFRVFGRLITRYPPPQIFKEYNSFQLDIWYVVTVALALFSIFFLFKVKNKLTMLLFSLWLFLGVILFGFYKKNIYDYYFSFMFPLPFFLIGNALGEGLTTVFKKKWVTYLGIFIAICLFLFNLYDWPFNYSSNRQKEKAENAAKFIISKTDNRPFNFALITKGNSDHAYRYFLHVKGYDPVTIDNTLSDPSRKSVTDQLFVICDFKDCSPLGHPLFEVAGFGRAEIAGKWDLTDSEVVIFKLIHYKEK